MIVRSALFIILMTGVAAANDQGADIKGVDKDMAAKMAREYVTCAAFYAAGAKCLEDDEDPSDRELLQKSTIIALQRASKYSKYTGAGNSQNIDLYRSYFDKMADRINMDCKKLQTLIDEHGKQCKSLMSSPQ